MKLLFFAWLKTRAGVGEEDVTPPGNVHTVGDLVAWLETRGPGYVAAFADKSVVRVAVNQEYRDFSAPLKAGDEVAFFPPVTGG